MKQMPLKMKAIMSLLGDVKKEALKYPKLLVVGEGDAGLQTIAKIIDPAEVGGNAEHIKILTLSERTAPAVSEIEIAKHDAVIVVIRAGAYFDAPTVAMVRTLKELRIPYAVVVDGIEALTDIDAFLERTSTMLGISMDKVVFLSTAANVGLGDLYKRLAELVPDKLMALVSMCPESRDAAVAKIIKRTAYQNALVGAVAILPGSDIQAILANQIKMVLSMAFMYGYELSKKRALELIAVLGSGLLFRAAARQLFDLVPGLGWAIKGTIAHFGTVALGMAAKKHFESEILGKRT